MRTQAAVIVVCCAFVAGAVTGQHLPPRHPVPPATASSPLPTSTPTARPTSPSRSAAPSSSPEGEAPPVPFGSSRLIQTDDFFQTGLALSAGSAGDRGERRLTGCTGARTMADLTGDNVANDAYADGTWHEDRATTGTGLTESVARAVTVAAAQRYVDDLTGDLAGCDYRQAGGRRHLGTPTTVAQHGGKAMVYLSSSSDGSAYGGVVVFRSGKNIGVAELTDAQVDQVGDTDLMKSLAAIALFRVKDPG